MHTLTLVWIVTVVGALVCGVCFVGVLVVRRTAEPVTALLGISAFGFAAYSVVVISESYDRIDAVVYAFAFVVAGLIGGWAVASSLLERYVREPEPLAIAPGAAPAPESAAVVVVSCIEPAEYEPSVTAGMLQSLADEELIEPSMGVLPFMFFAQKARYRAVGGASPAARELHALAEALESMLKPQVGRVEVATCSGNEGLAPKVKELVEGGFGIIVVAEVTVGESLHLSAAKREADALRIENVNARLVFTGILSGSERILNMLAARVLSAVDVPSNTGVVLVGHGQPEGRSRANPAYDEQETSFLSRLRMRLIEQGVAEAHVRLAWSEWDTPDVTSTVRHLAALGCRRVVVLPAVFPFETIGTRLDLEIAVRQARVDDSVSIITLPAWRDDHAIVNELVDRIRAEL